MVLTLYPDISRGVQSADIIFVQNFRLPDLQGKNLSPKNCVIGDIFHYQFNRANALNITSLGTFWLQMSSIVKFHEF